MLRSRLLLASLFHRSIIATAHDTRSKSAKILSYGVILGRHIGLAMDGRLWRYSSGRQTVWFLMSIADGYDPLRGVGRRWDMPSPSMFEGADACFCKSPESRPAAISESGFCV